MPSRGEGIVRARERNFKMGELICEGMNSRVSHEKDVLLQASPYLQVLGVAFAAFDGSIPGSLSPILMTDPGPQFAPKGFFRL
jgi:hypothetical protein